MGGLRSTRLWGRTARPVIVAFLLFSLTAGPAAAQTVAWTTQFGGAQIDVARALAVDAAGNIYLAGDSDGLPGQPDAGGVEAWVQKYTPSGTLVWTRQFGTAGDEFIGFSSGGVAVGGDAVYVGGFTTGAFAGATNAGGFDAFLRKYDLAGNAQWTVQFGTAGFDDIHDVAADGSKSIYVAGSVIGQLPGQTAGGGSDGFVRKYDKDGNVVWTRQFGTAGFEHHNAIAFDSTGVYVTGHTDAQLTDQPNAGMFDIYVQRYDRDGVLEWTRQFGTAASDVPQSVAADAGGVYITGGTDGALPGQTFAGARDVFLAKFNPGGHHMWTRQFGTAGFDQGLGVSVRGLEVVLSGAVSGALPGQTYAGGPRDAFVRKYDTLFGNEVWTHQFGTPGFDNGFDVLLTSESGAVYVCGLTDGTLPGQTNSGRADAYLMKLAE
jgi:hypothetical protein